MTDLALFREYEPWELASDGYPFVWRKLPDPLLDSVLVDCPWLRGRREVGVKDIVRAEANDRCARCGHPYRVGTSEWSEVGQDVEGVVRQMHRLLLGGEKVPPPPRLRGVQWSPCDEQCTHDGPARARVNAARPWEDRPLATAADIERALSQRNEVQAAWRILTVHHLNERKHDLRWFNLASLCQRCHLHIQKKVNMARIYPFEHTTWFKPYAAGWYAVAYLGEYLTREQTMERLEELLALERIV